MIPFRKPVEAIGAAVSYDQDKKEVTAVKGDTTVKLVIGENRIFVNGQETPMDTMAVIRDGRAYIPVRAVFSALGYDLTWHSGSNTVYITEHL